MYPVRPISYNGAVAKRLRIESFHILDSDVEGLIEVVVGVWSRAPSASDPDCAIRHIRRGGPCYVKNQPDFWIEVSAVDSDVVGEL